MLNKNSISIFLVLIILFNLVLAGCDNSKKRESSDRENLFTSKTDDSYNEEFVVTVNRNGADEGIILTESINDDGTPKDPKTTLSAPGIDDVTSITFDWIPTNLNDECDGEHNGENYFAYTFYLINGGGDTIESITSDIKFTKATKNVDEALRVMIYKDGIPTIYAQKNRDGSQHKEEVNKEFFGGYEDPDEESYIIAKDFIWELKPHQNIKYTIVLWVEGNDPECVNEIMSGSVELEWNFDAM